MAVHLTIGVEEVYEDSILAQKGCGYKRVWKICDRYGPIVNTEPLIDTKLVGLLIDSKSLDVELSIVHVTKRKVSSVIILI